MIWVDLGLRIKKKISPDDCNVQRGMRTAGLSSVSQMCLMVRITSRSTRIRVKIQTPRPFFADLDLAGET